MFRTYTLVPTLLVALFAGCRDQPQTPTSATASIQFSTTSEIAGEGVLTVQVLGISTVKKVMTVKMTANASGGTGPYYYTWFDEPCYDIASCQSPGPPIAQGWGLDSLHVHISEFDYARIITAQVSDSQTGYATGAGQRRILGPAAVAPNSTTSAFCGTAPNWYVHRGPKPDASIEWFSRNPCSGAKMWKPEGSTAHPPATPRT